MKVITDVIQFNTGGMSGGSGGASAELISNASFATLMVIYSFTQLMDMADQLSELAGLTSRVAQLMEVRFTHARTA